MVSGGNMANFVCFLAARRAKADWDVRQSGLAGDGSRRLRIYASTATHTWIQKAADLFGHGTDAIRWIETDREQRLDVDALRRQIVTGPRKRRAAVSRGRQRRNCRLRSGGSAVGTWHPCAGTMGCGSTLMAPTARVLQTLLGTPADLAALKDADSVSVDPHKWLYAPLEAGCALVRKRGPTVGRLFLPSRLTTTSKRRPRTTSILECRTPGASAP